MKKLIFILTLTLLTVFSFTAKVSADDDGNVDLYPYDQIACHLAEDACTNYKVGSSNWSFVYSGHRYYSVNGGARYVTEWVDADLNGYYDAAEIPAIGWNAFAMITINDTDTEAVMSTTNHRTDLTTVVHRKYAHFDENGVLQMFEDHVSKYYMYNDGTVLLPDWRLATVAEEDAYKAEVTAGLADGDPSADGLTRHTMIRIALDDTDTDGYVVEPIGWLVWSNADVDTGTAPIADWSTIVDGDPAFVTIPAGWTVVSFGTLDRGTANPLTTAWILTYPAVMAAGTVDPMELDYADQPGWFNNLTAQDDDVMTDGVNIVVDYNGTWDLPLDVTATWRNMFDDTSGDIINAVEELDYEVVISQGGVDLETIDMVWDGTVYVPSAAVTMVDTSVFAGVYTATYNVTTPEGDEFSRTADIIVGVMPPTFAGVEDQYVDEGVFFDLLGTITADDGYGNDLTSTIGINYPTGFNFYNPLPGEYNIGLEFTHHVHFDGIDPLVDLNGNIHLFDGTMNAVSTDWDSLTSVYDDVAAVQALPMSWGSSGMIVVVAADHTVIETLNRHNWDYADVSGFAAGGAPTFDPWLAALTIEAGGYIVVVGYNEGGYADAQALRFGDVVTYDLTQVLVFDYDIVTESSYVLTVDDITNPFLLVVNPIHTIAIGEFDTVNDAILSNVAAFDGFTEMDDLTVYVSNNGGLALDTAGTYNVEVTVADEAGNTAVEAFQVVLVETFLTDAEIQALIDDAVRTDAAIQALIDADVRTDAEIQALIDAAIDEYVADLPVDTGCGSSLTLGSALVFGVMALGTAVLFKVKKSV